MRAKRRAGQRRSKTYATLCSGSAGAHGKRATSEGTGLSRGRLSQNERHSRLPLAHADARVMRSSDRNRQMEKKTGVDGRY